MQPVSFRSIAAAAVLIVTSSLSYAQETLAWKFNSGETLKYVVDQSTNMELNLGGQKQGITMSQSMEMAWKIADVASNGDAQMSQVVERVKMTSDGGPFGNFEYDSASATPPESPLGKTMADVFSRIIGQDFAITMKPSGRIQKVEVPPSLMKALSQAGAAGNAMNEETLKQMMTQSAVTLPEKPVRKGDAWESSQKVELPFGTMTVNSQLTYLGVDASSGMAQIGMKPSVSVKPKEGAPLTLTISESEGKGVVLFDLKSGRISRSDLELNLEMQIKQFNQTVNQSLHQKTSMVLAP